MPTPGERLECDAHAAAARPLAEFPEIVGGTVDPAQALGRDIGAHHQEIAAELLHGVELSLRSGEDARALRLGHALEISERLVDGDPEAEVTSDPPHVRRRTIEGQEVVLKNLHRLEAGCGDRLQLLGERAAQANSRDGGLHGLALLLQRGSPALPACL